MKKSEKQLNQPLYQETRCRKSARRVATRSIRSAPWDQFRRVASTSVCRQYNPSIHCWDLHWCECLCEKKKPEGGGDKHYKKDMYEIRSATRWKNGRTSAINQSINQWTFFPQTTSTLHLQSILSSIFTFNYSPWTYSNLKTIDVLNVKDNQDKKNEPGGATSFLIFFKVKASTVFRIENVE